jgi:hypothetical protein
MARPVPANLQPHVFRRGESSTALKHGARSAILIPPRAEELAEGLREIVPTLTEADEPMIRLAATTMAQVERLTDYLEQHGILDGRGNPRPCTRFYFAAINSLHRQLRDLGCTPVSRAGMGYDLVRAHSEKALAELRQEGQRVRLQAERRRAE